MHTVNKIRTTIGILAGIAMIMLIGWGVDCAFADNISLRLGHVHAASHPYNQTMLHFAESVKEASGGRLDIKVFPGGQLGNEKAIDNGLVFGTIDLTITAPSFFADSDPVLNIFNLPFLWNSIASYQSILDGDVGDDLAQRASQHGWLILSYLYGGSRHVTNNKRPVRTPDDLKDVKLRAPNVPLYLEFINAMGAKATPLAFSEIYFALQTGVVDGQENPFSQIYHSKFYEVQKYLSLTNHIITPAAIVIGTKAYAKLSGEDQKIIKNAALEARQWHMDLMKAEEEKLLDFLSKNMQVNSDVDMEAFRKKQKPVYDKALEKGGADMQKIVDRINNLQK